MRCLLLSATAVLVAALAGCGGPADPGADSESDAAVQVSAAFYPLELAVERIGGDRVEVTSLTKPGAEAHDVELTPREVGALAGADLIVFLSGFQPAVDDAVGALGNDAGFDVAPFADLTLTADHHGHHEDDGHDHEGTLDPHFWLDPTRYASVAEAITDRLVEIDPEGATAYQAGSDDFVAELTALDEELMAGLQTCRHRDLVTGHAAFGYLADRYDLYQIGIAGLTPDNEPTAAQIRDLVEHVRETGVSTVYAEVLVNPALAETVAREAGVQVKVLDPLEGITDASAGTDYFEVMRANLRTLQEGQECT